MAADEALLAAVCENPDDDAPRLVYADWLEEHGNPDRAEFIRVQIDLARGSLKSSHRRRLVQREQALLKRHEAEWQAALPPLPGITWFGHTRSWERGFVAAVTVAHVRAFRQHAARLFTAAPVQHVDFSPRGVTSHTVLRLIRTPELARVRSLSFWGSFPGQVGNLGPAGAAALAGCPYLAGLTELKLTKCGIGSAGAAALARSPHLTRLKALRLETNAVDADGARALVSSRILDGVNRLDLTGNPLGPRGARWFAEGRRLPRLRIIFLDFTSLGAAGARALANSPSFPGLTELYLMENALGDAGVRALAESAHLNRLVRLDLEHNRFGMAGALALARSGGLKRLARLEVSPYPSGIGAAAIDALRRRFGDRLEVR